MPHSLGNAYALTAAFVGACDDGFLDHVLHSAIADRVSLVEDNFALGADRLCLVDSFVASRR